MLVPYAFLDIKFHITSGDTQDLMDFLAGDQLPEYGKEKETCRGTALTFSGRRVRRGLYRHADGRMSNADINGAANILRKVFPNVKEWGRGVVDTPYVVGIA